MLVKYSSQENGKISEQGVNAIRVAIETHTQLNFVQVSPSNSQLVS